MFDLSNLVNLAKTGADIAKNASEVASVIKKGSSALNIGKGKKQAAAAKAPTQPDGEAQFSPALEKLIAMAVADGEITDDEMTLLRRKAEKEGVDPDEMEFIVRRRIRKVTVTTSSHKSDIEKESKGKEKDNDEPEQPRNSSRNRRKPLDDDDDFDDDIDIGDDESLTKGIMNSLKGKLGDIVDEIMG